MSRAVYHGPGSSAAEDEARLLRAIGLQYAARRNANRDDPPPNQTYHEEHHQQPQRDGPAVNNRRLLPGLVFEDSNERGATNSRHALRPPIPSNSLARYAPASTRSSSISPRTVRLDRDEEPVTPDNFYHGTVFESTGYTPPSGSPVRLRPPPSSHGGRNAMDTENHLWRSGLPWYWPRTLSDQALLLHEEMDEDRKTYNVVVVGWVRVPLSLAGRELMEELGNDRERQLRGSRAKRRWSGVDEVMMREDGPSQG